MEFEVINATNENDLKIKVNEFLKKNVKLIFIVQSEMAGYNPRYGTESMRSITLSIFYEKIKGKGEDKEEETVKRGRKKDEA